MVIPHRICEQLVDSYKMSLSEIIQDVELQINMIIRGEFRIQAEAMAEEGVMGHIEHFREIIGIIKYRLIVLLAKNPTMEKIMRITSMGIAIILITNGGLSQRQVNFAEMITMIPKWDRMWRR